jgi:MYXO-CTERM domain-containing protein
VADEQLRAPFEEVGEGRASLIRLEAVLLVAARVAPKAIPHRFRVEARRASYHLLLLWRTLSRMARKLDRQIDDALLAAAVSAGVLYARRRVRRVGRKVARGAVAAGGGAAGVGALGVAGAAAWQRRRSKMAKSDLPPRGH